MFNPDPAYAGLIPLLTLGLATLTFAAAFIFMMAQVFRTGEWETQAKTELYMAISTCIWGLVIFSAALSVDKITTAYCYEHGCSGNMFDGAHAYVSQVICLSTTTAMQMEGYKIGLQYLSGMKSKYYAGPWGFSFPTYPGFEVIERAVDLVQMFIIPFTSSLYVQVIGLDIIHACAITVLLPAAVLLRLFPPTREAGGFLMATAFALYFILPFTYLIHKEVMETLFYNEYGRGMCGGQPISSVADANPNELFSSMAARLRPDRVAADLLKYPTLISYVAVQSVFLPALSMIFVVTFIRTATRFFSQGME